MHIVGRLMHVLLCVQQIKSNSPFVKKFGAGRTDSLSSLIFDVYVFVCSSPWHFPKWWHYQKKIAKEAATTRMNANTESIMKKKIETRWAKGKKVVHCIFGYGERKKNSTNSITIAVAAVTQPTPMHQMVVLIYIVIRHYLPVRRVCVYNHHCFYHCRHCLYGLRRSCICTAHAPGQHHTAANENNKK